MAKLYLAIIILSIFGGAGYGAKEYYDWSTSTIESLRIDKVLLEEAVATNEETIKQITADAEKTAELNRNLNKRLQSSQVHLDALRKRFSQIDLTMEALNNAEGLEERVNNAVTKLIGRIERETSSNIDSGASNANSVQ